MIFQFIPFLLTALGVAATAAAIIVAMLTFRDVYEWFKNRNAITEADLAVVQITIADLLASGKYRVVQGLYDKETNSFVDSRVVEADDMDDTLKSLHRDNQLVVHE